MGGFWSDEPYVGFSATFVCADELVVLDRYLIVERGRTRLIHNWFQQFAVEALGAGLAAAGFEAEWFGSVAGDAYRPGDEEFAVAARMAVR